MSGNFRFPRSPLLLVDYVDGAGFGVQLWMPPQGIWGAVTPRHQHATEASAMRQAIGFAVGSRGLLLFSPTEIHGEHGK